MSKGTMVFFFIFIPPVYSELSSIEVSEGGDGV